MKIRKILFCCLLFSSNYALAQYANIEGRFKSATTELNLIALDSESGVIAESTSIVVGSCSGSVAGIGKMKGNALIFSPYTKVAADDACVVTVTFDKKRNTAKIVGESCSSYSGSSCGWEGETIKRAK
jgi:hypothetical protein